MTTAVGHTSTQLPRYTCHKEVWAVKIKAITLDSDLAHAEGRETTGGALITPVEAGFGQIAVDRQYMQKHNPQVGGYYVVYKDGYKSFSPAEAFEEGYTLVR